MTFLSLTPRFKLDRKFRTPPNSRIKPMYNTIKRNGEKREQAALISAICFRVTQSYYISSTSSYPPTENILIKSIFNSGAGGSPTDVAYLPVKTSSALVVAPHLSHHFHCEQK